VRQTHKTSTHTHDKTPNKVTLVLELGSRKTRVRVRKQNTCVRVRLAKQAKSKHNTKSVTLQVTSLSNPILVSADDELVGGARNKRV